MCRLYGFGCSITKMKLNLWDILVFIWNNNELFWGEWGCKLWKEIWLFWAEVGVWVYPNQSLENFCCSAVQVNTERLVRVGPFFPLQFPAADTRHVFSPLRLSLSHQLLLLPLISSTAYPTGLPAQCFSSAFPFLPSAAAIQQPFIQFVRAKSTPKTIQIHD